MIVLHYTGMRDGATAIGWLCNPASQVSCHYVVDEDGGILQLVPEHARAWHAGRASWAGIIDINSVSVGIEIVNGGHDFGLPSFPELQIKAVTELCLDIMKRNNIRPERVLAHSDVAPARKRDPGERFPWRDLSRSGVGVWAEVGGGEADPTLNPGSTGPSVSHFQGMLAHYGYGITPTGRYDPETENVVRAFQRHFRPERVDGCADAQTQHTLKKLIEIAASTASS